MFILIDPFYSYPGGGLPGLNKQWGLSLFIPDVAPINYPSGITPIDIILQSLLLHQYMHPSLQVSISGRVLVSQHRISHRSNLHPHQYLSYHLLLPTSSIMRKSDLRTLRFVPWFVLCSRLVKIFSVEPWLPKLNIDLGSHG